MSFQEQKITDAAIAASGVQSRPDKLTGTAAENKKVFDNLVTAVVKEKLNALIDELTGTGSAGQLGITAIPGFSASDVQTALEQIVKAMQDVTQGSVTDGSITLAKLAEEVLALINGKQPLTQALTATQPAELLATQLAGEVPVYVSGANKKATLNVLIATFKNSLLSNGAIKTAMLDDAVVTAEKLAALAVQAQHIAAGAVTTQKIAALAIVTALLADGCVTAEKLADGIPYTKVGLAADQVRHIYTGTAEPSADTGSDGDIYIQYTESDGDA